MRFKQHCFLWLTGLFFSGFASAQIIVANDPDTSEKESYFLLATTATFPVGIDSAKRKERLWSISIEGRTTGTTNNVVPFWMRANQHGSIPLSGASGSFIGRVVHNYNTQKSRFLDWGMAVEARANLGKASNLTLVEGYAKIKLGPFTIRGGRVKEYMGLVDSTLSSGAFSESGNALGIPKVEIIVPEFYPFLGGKLFAFKGNFAHGWLGEIERNHFAGTGNENLVNTYFHQKSFYGRFGRPGWKIRLYGGFNHQVFWGDEKIRYGSGFNLSSLETYWYVIAGKKYQGTSSKIGNHLGSIDIGMELNFRNFSIFAYRQNFYEVGALYYLANIQDGLHGLRITNKRQSHSAFKWRKILLEFLYSKNQAGEPWSRNTKSGAENYYNSAEYKQGWSYQGQALGTPFFSPDWSTRKGFPNASFDYFNNNRISLLHTGIEGMYYKTAFAIKLSYSKNYGTWRTNSFGIRYGGDTTHRRPPIYGVFTPVDQFSSYVLVSRALKNGLTIGGAFAFDYGGLLYNSAGVELRLAKSFY